MCKHMGLYDYDLCPIALDLRSNDRFFILDLLGVVKEFFQSCLSLLRPKMLRRYEEGLHGHLALIRSQVLLHLIDIILDFQELLLI